MISQKEVITSLENDKRFYQERISELQDQINVYRQKINSFDKTIADFNDNFYLTLYGEDTCNIIFEGWLAKISLLSQDPECSQKMVIIYPDETCRKFSINPECPFTTKLITITGILKTVFEALKIKYVIEDVSDSSCSSISERCINSGSFNCQTIVNAWTEMLSLLHKNSSCSVTYILQDSEGISKHDFMIPDQYYDEAEPDKYVLNAVRQMNMKLYRESGSQTKELV